MFVYLVRRLLQVIPTLLVISLIVFGLLALKPGDPIDEMRRGNPGFTQQDYDRLREFYGLDRPWYVQYWRWLGRVLHGDFGISRQFGRPAAAYIFQYRFPNTVLLSGLSLLLAFLISVPTGALSAIRQHTAFDYTVTVVNFVGVSIP